LGLKDTNYKKTKKNSTLYDSTKKSRKSLQGIDDMTLQLKVVEKFKDQIEEYDEKIDKLQTENEELKLQKSKMENMQNQVFEKLKKYTEETSNMKNMYDIIKKDIQEDSFTKINDLNLKLNKSEEENKKLKERIYELINIGENAQKSERDRLIKVQRDNDIYAKLLDTKKKEIEIYKEELEKFRGNLEKLDGRDTKKIKKLENQNDLITKNKNELEANVNNLNNIIEQKDNQINNLKNTIEALSEQIKIKDEEITLLNEKIKEFEDILNKKIINYNKLNI
jgi:chromosome segregation ATPase